MFHYGVALDIIGIHINTNFIKKFYSFHDVFGVYLRAGPHSRETWGATLLECAASAGCSIPL